LIIILLSISCIGFDLPKMVMFSVKLKKSGCCRCGKHPLYRLDRFDSSSFLIIDLARLVILV
jgi:hypothetical protein